VQYSHTTENQSIADPSQDEKPQLLLGHTKFESAAEYLEDEVDDAQEMAGQTEV